MSEGDESASPNGTVVLLPCHQKALQKVASYGNEKKVKVEKLSTTFEKKGYLKRVWDSKVPDKDFWFFHPFSLTASNRDAVLKEIKKYKIFYENLNSAVNKLSDTEDQTDAEREDPQDTIIRDLKNKLAQMHEAAELGKKDTASSTLYELHKAFIQRHEELQDMIAGAECVATYKKSTIGWQKSVQRICDLEAKVNTSIESCNRVCERVDILMSANTELQEGQRDLVDESKKLVKDQKALQQKYQQIEEEKKQLLQKVQEVEAELEKQRQEKQKMQEELEKQRQEKQKMREELEKLRNQKMKQEQNTVAKNQEIQEEKGKLVQNNQGIEKKTVEKK